MTARQISLYEPSPKTQMARENFWELETSAEKADWTQVLSMGHLDISDYQDTWRENFKDVIKLDLQSWKSNQNFWIKAKDANKRTFPFDLWEEVSVKSVRNSLVEERFLHLAARWRERTMFVSDPVFMVQDINYLRIIAMGASAIPFISEALESSCEHWFVALEAITGHSPELESESRNPERLREYWRNWLSHNK